MYKRVSCGFYDLLEMYGVQGQQLKIVYHSGDTQKEIISSVKTLETKDKAEYLVTAQNERIRLDNIVSVEVIQ